MRDTGSRVHPRFLFSVAAVAAAVAAFFWGNYLLGPTYGTVCATITLALFWLLSRSRMPNGSVSVLRVVFVLVLALPVGFAIAFPACVNSDTQVFIDHHATDRRARAELATVFESDPAYRNLSVSSVHLKVVNITVRGALGTRADLDRLRSRIVRECPALGECILHWDVILREPGQQLDGLDAELFHEGDQAHSLEPPAGLDAGESPHRRPSDARRSSQ